jgi:serine/threonine protein kinase
MADLTGKIIRDYRVTAFIGKGGHGAVYQAEHLKTGATVAIKVLLPEHSEDTELSKRLIQEADIVRELRHPHIVPLLETWQDGQGLYLVMRWIAGGDLHDYQKHHGAMSPETLSPILQQICSALDAAHAAQIVHRDLKPDNILLDNDGNAYLSDFGVAKRKNLGGITTVGTVVGTPNYLSPEQIMGEEVSNKTDIYALGITIHELLAGIHPYHDTVSRLQLMMKLVQQNLPPLTDREIPAEYVNDINGLIQRCTAKNPQDRYITASSVAYHFQEIIRGN